MNPYQWDVSCDICGEPGKGTFDAAEAAWLPGGIIYCENQFSCAANVKRRSEEKDKKIKELEEKLVSAKGIIDAGRVVDNIILPGIPKEDQMSPSYKALNKAIQEYDKEQV